MMSGRKAAGMGVFGRAATLAATLAAVAALATGCAPRPRPASPDRGARDDPDFLAPPSILRAERDGAGGVQVSGRAAPDAEVALVSPAGERRVVRTGGDGGWTLALPAADAPRAFALSAAQGERIVRGEGALLVAPAPAAPAVLMRGGAPAWPVAEPGAGLRWVSADMDAGGGAAVSGFAPPGAGVRLAIDGVESGAGQADATGRFGVLWLGSPVADGVHAVTVSTPAQSRSLPVRFAAAPLDGAAVRISREAQGWRIGWAPPGGGGQTTLVLDPPPASRPDATAAR